MSDDSRPWLELDEYVGHLNEVARGIERLLAPAETLRHHERLSSKLALLRHPEYQASEGNQVEALAAPLRRLRAAAEKALAELGAADQPPARSPLRLVPLSGGRP